MNADPTQPFRYDRRLDAVRAAFAAAQIDALLVSHPPNLRYLAGFDGSLGALLVLPGSAVLLVDGRYLTAASDRVAGTPALAGVDIVLVDRSHEETAASVLKARGIPRRLGVEAAYMTLARFERLKAALGGEAAPTLVPTERIVERGRMVKDEEEIRLLREAGRRLSAVAREVLAGIRVGREEREIAADIDAALRRAGFERPAFEAIVASGPNGARPHARAGRRVLQPGDGVVLDFGGVYDGYCVDLTRTVQLPPPRPEFVRMLEAVAAAQKAALKAVRPGVPASEVDRAARSELEARGLGEAFVHGTGHGLGLEVHEEPRVSRRGAAAVDEILQPGMVFTIEPGAYVAGLGGVRIEDDVLVTGEGCERLTDVPIKR